LSNKAVKLRGVTVERESPIHQTRLVRAGCWLRSVTQRWPAGAQRIRRAWCCSHQQQLLGRKLSLTHSMRQWETRIKRAAQVCTSSALRGRHGTLMAGAGGVAQHAQQQRCNWSRNGTSSIREVEGRCKRLVSGVAARGVGVDVEVTKLSGRPAP
jgi:hypothetical protein